jgi:hypothetical protein
MEIKEILNTLERNLGFFPRNALEMAIQERERISPCLLDIMIDSTEKADLLVHDVSYMAHIYAMFLLAQFREKRAYSLIVNFFSLPGEVSLDLTDDIVTEDLENILASVACRDDNLIRNLIENDEVNEYVRGAGMGSLVTMMAVDELPRDIVVDYFKSLFRGKLTREPSHVWDSLILYSKEIYPEELYGDIQESYVDGLPDPLFVDLSDIDRAMNRVKQDTLSRLRENSSHHLCTDIVGEIESWECFQAQDMILKIGRNDPCPCGSGKKYKKCCGNF